MQFKFAESSLYSRYGSTGHYSLLSDSSIVDFEWKEDFLRVWCSFIFNYDFVNLKMFCSGKRATRAFK